MADKNISSSNRASSQISLFSNLFKGTGEKAGNGGPPPPTVRCKESEQRILNRQRPAKSSIMQTKPDFIASPLPLTSAAVESFATISTGTNLPPLKLGFQFFNKSELKFEIFENVSDMNQLRSEIKQRFGIEEEFVLVGFGEIINDISPLREDCNRGWGSTFHVVLINKT
jgi:hypothetical protein